MVQAAVDQSAQQGLRIRLFRLANAGARTVKETIFPQKLVGKLIFDLATTSFGGMLPVYRLMLEAKQRGNKRFSRIILAS